MVAFIVQRLLLAVLTIWVISVLSFAIIQLPPGDFVTAYIAQARQWAVASPIRGDTKRRAHCCP